MARLRLPVALLLAAALPVLACAADNGPAYGPQLEGFDYPWPVHRYEFTSQQQHLQMAYLDVAPTGPANGRTAVLLHGKNFCAATWEDTIKALSAAGWRVIAPDQLGFCKSTKPAWYQYTVAGLAANTRALLQSLGIARFDLVGHSMGGMLAIRYALTWPQDIDRLALIGPLGLEDWRVAGVPYVSVEQWYAGELKTDYDSIKRYQMDVYYAGAWEPRFERWARMQAGMYLGPGKEVVAWNQALTYDMLYNQPVVYELPRLQPRTTLFIGGHDKTAIGKGYAPEQIRPSLGNYVELGRRAARAIPHATLVEYPDLGHSPQVQDPARFDADLIAALQAP